MAEGPNLKFNVGWQVWNMSKRISSIKSFARDAESIVSNQEATREWSKEDRAELDRIGRGLRACGVGVEQLWERLQQVANEGDPGVVEPPVNGVSVTRNRGSDPATTERVLQVWGEGHHWIDDGYALGDDLKALVIRQRVPSRLWCL